MIGHSINHRIRQTCTVALSLLSLGTASACARHAATERALATSRTDLVTEARAFMDSYARDLLDGNRAGIAARYDRTGAYFVGNGRKEFMAHDSIVALYRGAEWSKPALFEWRDLSFEPAGPDAIVVVGRFLWGRQAGATPASISYTGLLHRQDGVLRIRVEDESAAPRAVPTTPARRDSLQR